jgi:glycosyltransferase involved in cell wall biosynthesis
MRHKLPKVLVISTNAWRDNTGINTLIEFFKCWDSNRIAQVYTKTSLPNTTVCNHFFRISENAVMKSIFIPKVVTGMIVQNEAGVAKSADASEEQKMYAKYRKKNIRVFMSVMREFVWKFGKWHTQELDHFLYEFGADVLYIPIYPTIYMGMIQKYIIEKTKKPVVSYLADDNYTYKSISKNPIALIHRAILRKYVKYIVEHSSKVMVIAPKQKEEYDRIFGVDSIVMTKGVDFEPFEPNEVQIPIRMVYTGKLIIGRWKSLAAIAESMGKINSDGNKVELDIYCTDILTDEQKYALNRNGCTVKGALTLDQVKVVQKQADILVFVESLEDKYRYTARLSFSTKITDYLKSGKCIFAIGDKEIAPIDYFTKYDSAVIASNYEEIHNKLEQIVSRPELISEYARKGYKCGVEHHERSRMDELLIKTISETMQ